jgi:hypothetical protein
MNVFLLCYNERAMLPHTVNHYKKHLPSCTITVYDNESTDGSAALARQLGWSRGGATRSTSSSRPTSRTTVGNK